MKCAEEVWYFAPGYKLQVEGLEAKRVFSECVSKIDRAFSEAFGYG